MSSIAACGASRRSSRAKSGPSSASQHRPQPGRRFRVVRAGIVFEAGRVGVEQRRHFWRSSSARIEASVAQTACRLNADAGEGRARAWFAPGREAGLVSDGLALLGTGTAMTIAEDVEPRPLLPLPPRPARPLSTWQLLKALQSNSLARMG